MAIFMLSTTRTMTGLTKFLPLAHANGYYFMYSVLLCILTFDLLLIVDVLLQCLLKLYPRA